jgi:hypothetical protein
VKDNTEIKVFITSRESTCDECGEVLGSHAWITLSPDKGALCLTCADLDHLSYLPSGDAALTRRAKSKSPLSAVVLKWSRSRKRYERQGLLVEEKALEQAEAECLADADLRQARRVREAERREAMDTSYVKEYADWVRLLYPHMPSGLEVKIAEHACLKYSGRVGRSDRAKKFDPEAIALSVIADIRHTETDYDELLMRGVDRRDARGIVKDKIDDVLEKWRQGPRASR